MSLIAFFAGVAMGTLAGVIIVQVSKSLAKDFAEVGVIDLDEEIKDDTNSK